MGSQVLGVHTAAIQQRQKLIHILTWGWLSSDEAPDFLGRKYVWSIA
jgi:hypothetical protein